MAGDCLKNSLNLNVKKSCIKPVQCLKNGWKIADEQLENVLKMKKAFKKNAVKWLQNGWKIDAE